MTPDMPAAPRSLERRRATRYRGEDRAHPLSAFADGDAATISDLYAWLRDLREAAGRGAPGVAAHLAGAPLGPLVERVRGLGRDTQAPALRGVIHDLRGGALNALVLQLSRTPGRGTPTSWATSVQLLSRDHQKVMRSLVADLDPEARARDLAPIPHSLGTLVEALRDFPAEVGGEPLDLAIQCDLDATIAESCVECGAIDRCTYNLLNNATRHALPPTIGISFRAVGEDLRVEVDNRVAAEHAARLAPTLARGAAPLFGAFSTTGSGEGLSIVASLVGSAYGIPDARELVDGGHVGARCEEDRFRAWFHWPLAGA